MAKRPHSMDNNPTKASANPPDAALVDPSNSADTLLDLSGEEPSDNEMSDASLQNNANVENTLSHSEAVLQGIDDRDTRAGRRSNELYDQAQLDVSTTGGDIYTNQYQAEVLGEEAVGGTTPTPDQDIVENLGASMGTDIPDRKPVNGRGMLERRDDKRWELDPQSSEDYEQHRP